MDQLTKNHTMFPSPGLQFLSAFIHFIGVTVLTYFLSVRLASESLLSRQGWTRLTWPRVCILLVFLDSYLFIFSTGLLIFGVGMQTNRIACAAGIYLCVIFYTTSKILIYAFLTEKVYIVWGSGTRRLRCPVYLICMGTIALYTAVILAMFFGRIAHYRDGDRACVIGLKPTASLPLVSYDLYINVLLTFLFLWPLFRNANSKLRRVATRTLIASLAALTTSTVNIIILTILHGRELSWLCLGSCGTDVILNAAALFWVTSMRPTPIQSQQDSVPSTPQASTSQKSGLRPFNLLSNSTPRAPTEVQIRVTTTSNVETSPPARLTELAPGDLDFDGANDDISVQTKRCSDLDSEKSIKVLSKSEL
ncbi:hypothetical protein FB451DRAFT_1469342 [Mycena latifolia]|nr:hypothetical protein FB451DRAFT_1469342 [Mycena latifolia]